MSHAHRRAVWLAVFGAVPAGCTADASAGEAIPGPPREFRAAWVATVANIDWPRRPGLPVADQKRDATAILDRLVELRMNAVVFQVRPHADALYASTLEPWSAYLTGSQGVAPDPVYDPLRFWIDAAHARGLQLHAWFNPYRANHPGHPGDLAAQSVARAHPEWIVKLGDKGYLWMDPALPAVQDHTVAVVLDVVRRYDVDGVHLDDYFYPYPSYNDGVDFPDERSYAAHRAAAEREGDAPLARADWRRAAVDRLIERLHREIKAVKPHVEFGVSPFGIWRPGHPSGIAGFDQFDSLYADARRWWREGWVDYLTPQLYWPIAQVQQSFPVLLGWWSRENTAGRHLWPGTSLRSARGPGGASEIVGQVMVVRGMLPESPGICVFSMRGLMPGASGRRPDVGGALRAGPFARPALIPATPWLDGVPPAAPVVAVRRDGEDTEVSWVASGEERAFQWVVYAERGGAWTHEILPGSRTAARLQGVPDRVAVTAVDRSRNESPRRVVDVAAR